MSCVISVNSLTKQFGNATAVSNLSFKVVPGVVTGFLGPNGSGKSTTMRMIMGLDTPTSGTALVNGKPYTELNWPLREVGALLDAKAFHPARTAYSHLRCLAYTNDVPLARVDEVLGIVGLTDVGTKRAGKFSLGMGQRLGIAGALLGDPGVLLFDEPVNGLDPEGIRWVRNLLRSLAAEGRSVFVSSHLISEMALTADRLVVIGRGALIADTTVSEFTALNGGDAVRVVTPVVESFVAAVRRAGGEVDIVPDDSVAVRGMTSAAVGELIARERLIVHELTPMRASLEDAFMELTRDAVEYRSGGSTDAALIGSGREGKL
jgi:ABC-2 type transport system ATP-binding protein